MALLLLIGNSGILSDLFLVIVFFNLPVSRLKCKYMEKKM